MTEKISKLLTIFDMVYHIILLNTLFLITNSFFFQIFFFIDFQVIFFPLYFVVSLPLIPSLLALLRAIGELKVGREVKLAATYFRELRFTLRNEYRIWGSLVAAVFLTLTALYASTINSPLTIIFYSLNIVLLVCEGLLFINLLRNGLHYKKSSLIENLVASFLPNAGKNSLLLVMIVLSLFSGFRLSFTMIIFIFGVLLEIMYRFFIKPRKG